eukprot:TRINITY_DN975_c0_g4_i4.p1 TRINITY_DN975_c0_g4~~TRINITY_DN975_c0_g4_i4.p1  ORF type:complete len:617 (+),score=114.41 TRINITY_DN975_c0_g4_i4:253-2103(+)
MSDSEKSTKLPELFMGTFQLGRKLGNGSFGEVYEGVDVTNPSNRVAIKVESCHVRHPKLRHEAKVLCKLSGTKAAPEFRYFGEHFSHNVLIADALGPNLEELFQLCGRKFTMKTVCMLGFQMVGLLEAVHKVGYLHRDVKPENFLAGLGSNSNRIYVIDFGLSKAYVLNSIHIPCITGKRGLTGTARYASIRTHCGTEQSRRDDLESLGYVLAYFMRGNLPWQGLRAHGKESKFAKIAEMKMKTSVDVLCSGLPDEMKQFLNYVRSLPFDAEPNYAFLQSCFLHMANRVGVLPLDWKWDWSHCSPEKIERSRKRDREVFVPPETAVGAHVTKRRRRVDTTGAPVPIPVTVPAPAPAPATHTRAHARVHIPSPVGVPIGSMPPPAPAQAQTQAPLWMFPPFASSAPQTYKIPTSMGTMSREIPTQQMPSQISGFGVPPSGSAPLGGISGIIPMRASMPMCSVGGCVGGCGIGSTTRAAIPGSVGAPLTVLPTFIFPQVGPDGQLSLVPGRTMFSRVPSPEIPEPKRRTSCRVNSADTTKTPGICVPTSEAPFLFSGGMMPPSPPRAFSPIGFAAISNGVGGGSGVRVGIGGGAGGSGGLVPGFVNPQQPLAVWPDAK